MIKIISCYLEIGNEGCRDNILWISNNIMLVPNFLIIIDCWIKIQIYDKKKISFNSNNEY